MSAVTARNPVAAARALSSRVRGALCVAGRRIDERCVEPRSNDSSRADFPRSATKTGSTRICAGWKSRNFAPAETSALSLDAAQNRLDRGGRHAHRARQRPLDACALAPPARSRPASLCSRSGSGRSTIPRKSRHSCQPRQARSTNAFEQLNLAFFEDGVVIDIADSASWTSRSISCISGTSTLRSA